MCKVMSGASCTCIPVSAVGILTVPLPTFELSRSEELGARKRQGAEMRLKQEMDLQVGRPGLLAIACDCCLWYPRPEKPW